MTAGGGGSGFVAIGTQPMAAALANGSQAATEAILLGGMIEIGLHYRVVKSASSRVVYFANVTLTEAAGSEVLHHSCFSKQL